MEDSIFKALSADLSAGHTEGMSHRILSLAQSTDDPMDILKCMSFLKLLPNDGTEGKLANMLCDLSDDSNGYDIASALINLDCPIYALDVLDRMTVNDRVIRLKCRCMYDLEEFESALEIYHAIKDPVVNDRILLSKIQSSLGEHNQSIDTSTKLLGEFPRDYDVRIAYVNSLLMGGHVKEVSKYARDAIKDKSADSYAIAAHALRVQGNIKAAGGYASRAVSIDNTHIGAMETLGICLAMKSEYDKARIVAGAINELSPGNKAAINILSYCEGN